MKLLLRRTLLILILAVTTLGGVAGAYRLHPKVRKKLHDVVYAAQHPHAAYDERMTWQMGQEYQLYKLVSESTLPDAVILLSPVPEASLCNRGRMSYFLYPRTLVPAGEWNRSDLTHAFVVQGYVSQGVSKRWPDLLLGHDSWGIIDLASGEFTSLEFTTGHF